MTIPVQYIPADQPAQALWLPPSSYLASEQEAVVGSPWWWLKRLLSKLDTRWATMRVFDEYYEGAHPIAYATERFKQAFGELFNAFADNWCPIVVDASVERLVLQGFRFGNAGEGADTAAWDIWQANGLDAEAMKAHTEAVKLGESAIIVDQGEDERWPQITVEHPSQVIVDYAPGGRRRAAALKRWIDDDGYLYATVYLPDRVYKFRTETASGWGLGRWVERAREAFEVTNELGVVPVIPLCNNGQMIRGGRSDLKVGLPIQDAINKACNDMMITSEFGGYRQRIMTGTTTEIDPVTGQPKKIELGADRLFTVPAPDAKVYDLAASDPGNHVKVVEMFVQHLAAQTRTPPHYLVGEIVNASGDALKAAEAGLVFRTARKIVDFSDSWEEAMRLAFRIRGGADDATRADATDAEALWRDPENKSDAELTDAAVKMRNIGVPLETCWEHMKFTPQQIARMKTLAGLPDRPPPGATTADVPPVLDGPPAGA